MRPIAWFLVLCLALPATARAYQSSPPRQDPPVRDWGPVFGPYRSRIVSMMPVDFGEQYLYAPANRALSPPGVGEKRVVFLGDSITDSWNLAKFFPGKPYVNRGIAGQVTPQMLVRFHADVVKLRPKAVVILAGINDVAGGLQVETTAQIEANWQAMAEMAVAKHIEPIFTLLLPVHDHQESSPYKEENRKLREELNSWLSRFCLDHHYGLVDYTPALIDDQGTLADRYSADGLHPNDAAYAVMAPIAARVIEEVVGRQNKP